MIDREAPGIAEAIRADALARTPHALLSRGVAGLRGATLVVNLPGSPGGCRDGFAVLQPALRHGLELAAGDRPTAAPADVTRRRRCTASAPPRVARPDRAHGVRASVRVRRRVPRGGGWPGLGDIVWITVAMVGARTLRDGAEPPRRRRARRAQPAHRGARAAERGARRARRCSGSRRGAFVVFLVAVFQLDPIVRWLWPIPSRCSSSTRT